MNALASMHKPGSRLPELDPFELEKADEREVPQQALEVLRHPQIPGSESAYGCVEWYQYLGPPAATPAVPGGATHQRCERRR
jgi:hypothetical protein